jgi:hypothetical protein
MDAPEGTPAEAVMPLLSSTLTMTVGLPRESRISNAVMFLIVVIVFAPVFPSSVTPAISPAV